MVTNSDRATILVEAGGTATVTNATFQSTSGDSMVVLLEAGSSMTMSESQLVGSGGRHISVPCNGAYPTCAGAHVGPVTFEGPSIITNVAPLVCDVHTGQCLSDLCQTGVNCGAHGHCTSPYGTCACTGNWIGERCQTHDDGATGPCCGSDKNGCSGCHTEDRWTDANGNRQRGCEIDSSFWTSCHNQGCACVFGPGCCPPCDTVC